MLEENKIGYFVSSFPSEKKKIEIGMIKKKLKCFFKKILYDIKKENDDNHREDHLPSQRLQDETSYEEGI